MPLISNIETAKNTFNDVKNIAKFQMRTKSIPKLLRIMYRFNKKNVRLHQASYPAKIINILDNV